MKDARSEAIKKISRKESGESESYENNLEKSERYMDGKNRFKSRYSVKRSFFIRQGTDIPLLYETSFIQVFCIVLLGE